MLREEDLKDSSTDYVVGGCPRFDRGVGTFTPTLIPRYLLGICHVQPVSSEYRNMQEIADSLSIQHSLVPGPIEFLE